MLIYSQMPEIVDHKKIYSLLEIAETLRQTISVQFSSAYWIKAEMNKLNHYPYSGHCYPELVEKIDGKMVAQMRGTLWKEDYSRINKAFLDTLQEPLKDGITILCLARPGFDPVYGLSLRITDIDPSFTLGELEREKRASVNQLIREGIFDRNKKQSLPLLPQRIAVISVETSKGYADFLKIINENPFHYRLSVMLFPAHLQGDKAGASIGYQLDRIARVKHHFDLVALIRGGGGDAGLSAYNNVDLARKVACFPLPVLTGIGHATNETVVEMVAFRNSITPTALADFLILQFQNVSDSLKDAFRIIRGSAVKIMLLEKRNYLQWTSRFKLSTAGHLEVSKNRLSDRIQAISGYSGFYVRNGNEKIHGIHGRLLKQCPDLTGFHRDNIRAMKQKVKVAATRNFSKEFIELEHLRHQVTMLDPKNVLSRGYSITFSGKKSIRSYTEINPGDVIKTIIFDGEINSTVIHSQKENNE